VWRYLGFLARNGPPKVGAPATQGNRVLLEGPGGTAGKSVPYSLPQRLNASSSFSQTLRSLASRRPCVRSDAQHRTPNTEHRTPNTEHRTPNTEHRTPNTEHRTPNTEHRTPNTQHRTPNTERQAVLHTSPGAGPRIWVGNPPGSHPERRPVMAEDTHSQQSKCTDHDQPDSS